MAGAAILMDDQHIQSIIAVRVTNTGHARFCHPGSFDLGVGDWVVVPSPAGEDAGRVVVGTRQVDAGSLGGPFPTVLRSLSEQEYDRVIELQARAISKTNEVAEHMRQSALCSHLTSLRYSLSGEQVVLTYRGDDPASDDDLITAIGSVVDAIVVTDAEPGAGSGGHHLFGGVGRVARDWDIATLLRHRFSVGQAFPEGLPRLGTRVMTDSGSGIVLRTRTKDWTAQIQLDHGDEITVDIASLALARDDQN